jgi:hypothetical protein
VFQSPQFTFWNITFTAIGVSVFWGKWGRTRLKAFLLSDILNLFHLKPSHRAAAEFIIFMILGCLIGIGVTQPHNAVQALTAGFGWTGFFAQRVSLPKAG